jgi:hypothetical protein
VSLSFGVGSGSVTDGIGEVGENEGAAVEIAEFAGFLNESLDRSKGDCSVRRKQGDSMKS